MATLLDACCFGWFEVASFWRVSTYGAGGGQTHAAGVAFRQVEDAVEEVFRLN